MWLNELLANDVLISSVFGWLCAQILKFLFALIDGKEIKLERFVGSGGMPSSHTAFVTSMTTAVALQEGLSSPAFAICFVLSFVVMYDASGVRRASGKQAQTINKLVENIEKDGIEVTDDRLSELIGHSPLEVIAGAVLGIAVAFVKYMIF